MWVWWQNEFILISLNAEKIQLSFKNIQFFSTSVDICRNIVFSTLKHNSLIEVHPFEPSMHLRWDSMIVMNLKNVLKLCSILIKLLSHRSHPSLFETGLTREGASLRFVLTFSQATQKLNYIIHSPPTSHPQKPYSPGNHCFPFCPPSPLQQRPLILLFSLTHSAPELMVILCQMQREYIRIIINCQSPMSLLPKLALLLMLLAVPGLAYFCSSSCIDYKGPCFNETVQGCMVCANNIFNMNANWSSPTPCSLAPQRTLVASDLPNSPSMSLTGFTSSAPTPVTCTNYTFSGKYASNDYLFKNYTNLALNHYAIVVRFNVGYVGAWTDSDFLRLSMTEANGNTDFDFKYYCGYGAIFDNATNITTQIYTNDSENINGEVGNATDCVRVKEYTLVHNTSYLAVNFTALTTQADTSVAFWGIKEVLVATKDCHAYCLTCYGGLNTQCLSCAVGYYLQGNVCLKICDSNLYVVQDTRTCVSQCPTKYYPSLNITQKICANCQSGCAMCSDGSTCLAWDGQQAYVPNLWKDKMQFWILLILVLCGLIGYIVYRLVKKALPSELEEHMMTKSDDKDSGEKEKEKEKEVNEVRISNLPGDTLGLQNDSLSDSLGPTIDMKGDTLWFNELVEMQPVEVKVRGRKRRPKEDPFSVNSFDANSNVDL